MVAFKKILFPTDFSANADKALAHAIRLADFDGGEVIVQHVVGNYFEKHPHWATLFDLHELQEYMDGYVEAHMTKILPKSTGAVRLRNEISKGKAAEEIAALEIKSHTGRMNQPRIWPRAPQPQLKVGAAGKFILRHFLGSFRSSFSSEDDGESPEVPMTNDLPEMLLGE